jgi:hypothetical protein
METFKQSLSTAQILRTVERLEESPASDLYRALQHPDRMVRILVLGMLAERRESNPKIMVSRALILCAYIEQAPYQVERLQAGNLLCRDCAALSTRDWNDDLHGRVFDAFSHNLRIRKADLPTLAVPSQFCRNDNGLARRITNIELTSFLSNGVPYWLGKALKSSSDLLPEYKSFLEKWQPNGEWAVKILNYYRGKIGPMSSTTST